MAKFAKLNFSRKAHGNFLVVTLHSSAAQEWQVNNLQVNLRSSFGKPVRLEVFVSRTSISMLNIPMHGQHRPTLPSTLQPRSDWKVGIKTFTS